MYNHKSFLEFKKKVNFLGVCVCVCVCMLSRWKEGKTDKVIEFPLLDASRLSVKYA